MFQKGQQIGRVGFSGNVSPSGEPGAHLHFMVIEDKNHDGNFEDNIPDGLVDPFGWQSEQPDPWENYSFSYAGTQRKGNKSYYLFTTKLDNLNASLTSNEAVFNVGKAKLEFPEGATNQNLNLSVKSEPNFTNNLLNSLGSIISVEAKNSAGDLVTTFLKNFSLTIDFSQFDLNRFNLDTLSIYSSPDGINWVKENTSIDLNNKTATTSISHLTYFALMAERKDTIAPTTIPVLNGEKGSDNNFHSDVNLGLNAADNEDGLGIEFTAYRIGENEWQTYISPIVFSDEGSHKVYFYSQDNDGNVEDIKTIEFSIDKTIPEAKVFVDPDLMDLIVQGIDPNPTTLTRQDNLETGKKNDEVFTVTDLAGNTLTLDVRDRDKDDKDQFRIYSLQYNQGQPILLDHNQFNISYSDKKGRSTIKEQSFKSKDEVKIKIQYDPKKDQSAIITKERDSEKIKEIRDGLVLLYLQTDKGELNYNY